MFLLLTLYSVLYALIAAFHATFVLHATSALHVLAQAFQPVHVAVFSDDVF